ncbi:hypothetical protein [Rhodohalobacter mucosus]|uniref:hypothetical protein n=1 Tax=Rhodohalobacter mucosus TaxID=2079485 RepID=UPI001304BE99|nr:hypothetical protein [Rhodohalobacter mucosus]
MAVTAFTVITMLEFNLPISAALLFFIFFCTVVAYNGIKYLYILKNLTRPFSTGMVSIGAISLFSLLGAAVSARFINPVALAASVIPGFLSVSYALPLHRRLKGLRQVYGLKIFVIGLVWAFVTVLLPFAQTHGSAFPDPEILAAFLQRLLFVIALTIPFDIRDRASDPESLGTIPMIFGNRNAILLGSSLLFVSLLIELLFRENPLPEVMLHTLIILLTGGLLWKSIHRHTDNLASFWVEGIPILWVLLFLLLRFLNP